MLSCQRKNFEIPSDLAFFNCAFLGPLPRTAREIGERAIARKAHPWTMGADDFFEDSERLRSSFAALLHTTPDTIALTPSASYGLAVAAKNLPLEPGKRILVLAEQFPSNVYTWLHRATSEGLTVETVTRQGHASWTDAVVGALGDDVALVAIPHCHWVDGGLLDLARIAQAVRSQGIPWVVDVTQSLGVVDFNATVWEPDFVVGAGYKWLLGPYSQGFLFAHPKYHEGTSIEHNWISRSGAEDFTQIANYTHDFQSGARRFDMGERSNFIGVPMMEACLQHILTWTVPEICARIESMTRQICASAVQHGYDALPDAHRSPHYLTLESATADAGTLRDALEKANVYVSVRGTRVRISPHVYNDDNDVDRLVDALAKAT